MSALRIGVLGAGHLGKIHINCIKELDVYELVGFYDPNETIALQVENEKQIKRFENVDDLIAAVDVVDIVTPTISHYKCALKAFKSGKHVFIEKPIAANSKEAEHLIEAAREAQVKVQVGHVERFNPAFIAARPFLENPMFIETHRLAQFNPRGTDVPVVLDLMIHDIDIILSVVQSKVKKISASGVSVVSDTPDIANARLEFENGCVANLTASRISMKNMRKSRFFQRNTYIAVDFLKKETEMVQMKDLDPQNIDSMAMILELGEGKMDKEIQFIKPAIQNTNAIVEELRSFEKAIRSNQNPTVTIFDGYKALDIANKILKKMKA
ncbi:MAG TPA: oxidoreductase [Bacteroidales bacterium]|nr:oxidoreductase [Bacteroidales bacterium]